MKNYIGQAGNFIKDNKKPLLYVGGAIAVVIVGYAIVSRVKSGITGFLKPNIKGQTDFKQLAVDNTKSTISDSLANNYANELYNSMKDTGTDTDVIYSIMEKLQKKNDFLKVYNAFGLKGYANYLGGVLGGGEPTTIYVGMYNDKNLVEWLREEVGYSNILTYNLVKKTVENAGLVF